MGGEQRAVCYSGWVGGLVGACGGGGGEEERAVGGSRTIPRRYRSVSAVGLRGGWMDAG